MTELFSPLVLRSGAKLRNRVAKAAMEEGMAGSSQLPDQRLISLYRRWGAGGAGLLITGNVMVHAEALTGPGGVVLDERAPLDPFTRWADAGKAGGTAMWMQISHPGRQVQAAMSGVVWAPSAVAGAAAVGPLPVCDRAGTCSSTDVAEAASAATPTGAVPCRSGAAAFASPDA